MASLRQKFHLVDNGLMAHVQSVGSKEWAMGGERFLMSVFIRGSAGVIRVSATSEQMCN